MDSVELHGQNRHTNTPHYRSKQAELIPVTTVHGTAAGNNILGDPIISQDYFNLGPNSASTTIKQNASVPAATHMCRFKYESSYQETSTSQSSPSDGLFSASSNSSTDSPDSLHSFTSIELDGTPTKTSDNLVQSNRNTVDFTIPEASTIELRVGDICFLLNKDTWWAERDPCLSTDMYVSILMIDNPSEKMAEIIGPVISYLYNPAAGYCENPKAKIKEIIQQDINRNRNHEWWLKLSIVLQSLTLLTILDEEYSTRFLRYLCRFYYDSNQESLPSTIDESVNQQLEIEDTLLESLKMARHYKLGRMEKIIIQAISYRTTKKSTKNTHESLFATTLPRGRPGGAIL